MPYGSVEDLEAIHAVLQGQRLGAQEGDARRATEGYADDADWINAFGVRRRGRVEIEAWLARLLADPGFRGARTTGPPPEVRFLRDDVAIAHSYQEVTGQVLRSGLTLPVRRVHHFRIMTREGGHWLVTSHIIMDERAVPGDAA